MDQIFGTRLGDPSNAWLIEFQRRADHERLASWQWSWFFDRLFKQTPEEANAVVRTRDVWPSDVPIAVQTWYPSILFRKRQSLSVGVRLKGAVDWVDGSVEVWRNIQLGAPREGQKSVAIELRMVLEGRVIWCGTIRHVVIGGHADTVLKPIASAQADDAVRGVIKGLVASNTGNLYLAYDRRGEHIGAEPEDWALGFRCEAIRDGQLVATGELLYPMIDKNMSVSDVDGLDYLMLTPVPGVEAVDRVGHWKLRVIGDAKVAVSDFEREYYWSGTVESEYGEAAMENGEPRHIGGG
jgi:hypothetical protein